MSASALETDYLVIGTGATAMAFVDTLLSEQADAKVLMVDRHHRPGGHWNEAYSFVRLHQPSEFYGVASRELSHGIKDSVGFNAGMYSLASGAQVLDYFDQVMQHRFLPSGRVQWLPMTEYSADADGAHRLRSLVNGESRIVSVRKKVVDATHAKTAVPSTHRAEIQSGSGRELHAPERAARHRPPACRVHRGGLGQDRHGRHPVAAGERAWRRPRSAG